MGYFMPVSSATQRRLAQVIEKRQADEEEESVWNPYEPDVPTRFADTVSGGLMPGLRIQQPGDVRSLRERREQASQEWITKPGTDPLVPEGIRRTRDIEVPPEERFPAVPFRSQAVDPAVDMARMKITNPRGHQEIVELAKDSTISLPDKYGIRTAIGQGNIAGADLSHLVAGTYQTPPDKVPYDGQNSKMIIVTPEEGNDDIYINELARNLSEGTVIRTEGESRFGTISDKQAFVGLGKIFLGFLDVASVPFEAFAETAFQATHTLPWKTTLWEDGFSATVEKHRSRGIVSQLAVGILFDPFVIGKAIKIPAGITRAAARAIIRRKVADIPDLTDAQRNQVAQQIEDAVVDKSERTIDFDNERWWSPAQQAWVSMSDQAAHVQEFGVPLIAGGAPIPGERAGSPFPGGRFWSGPPETFPIAPKLLWDARQAGISDVQLRRHAGNRRPTSQDLAALIAERTARLGGQAEEEALEAAMTPEIVNMIDQAAQLDGMSMQAAAASYSEQLANLSLKGPAYPAPYETVSPGALLRGFESEAEEAAWLRLDWREQNQMMFGTVPEPRPTTLVEKARRAQTVFEEATFDRHAGVAKQRERVKENVLELYNKVAVREGLEVMSKLPDSFDAALHVQLSYSYGAAGDSAWHMGRDNVLLALGNDVVDAAGRNVDTSAVDGLAALLHHIDAVLLKNADTVEGAIRRPADDAMTGGKRGGPHNMSVAEMRNTLESQRQKLGDTPEYRSKKAAHDRTELAKKTEAMAKNEPYTEVPYPPSAYDRVMKGVEALVEHYAHIRELYVDSGIMSRELATLLANEFKWYNPIKYVEGSIVQHVDVTHARRTGIIGLNQTSLDELASKGLHADLQRPMEAMAKATNEAYQNIFYNNTANAMINQSLWDKNIPAGLVRKVVTLEKGQTLRKFEIDANAAARKEYHGIKLMRVSRRVNGEHEIWEIPEVYANVLKDLNNFDQNLGLRIARMANRPFRMLFTSHNPVFMAANFLHDMMIVMMNEGVMPKELASSLMATLRDTRKRDPMMRAYIQSGADVGGYTGSTVEEIFRETTKRAERLAAGMEEFTTYEQWVKRLTSPARGLNYLSRAIELAPRRATFKTVLEREEARRLLGSSRSGPPVEIAGRLYDPESVRAAAQAARNVTVDFQKYGRAIKMFDALFLYTNAAIQGTLLPIRALRKGGVRLGAPPGVPMFARTKGRWGGWHRRIADHRAKVATLGFAGVAASVYAWNRTQFPDAYQNMSLQDRITRLQVIYGEEKQEDGTMRPLSFSMQPLLREFSAINGGIVLSLDKLWNLDSANATQFLTALVPHVNPLGTMIHSGGRDSSFGMQPLPTISAPGQLLNETLRNWDSFRNAPIVNPAMEELPEDEQYDEYTSETAKRVGGFFHWSPKRVDHMLRIGAMQDVVMGVDQLIQLNSGEKTEEDLILDSLAAELEDVLDDYEDPTERRTARNQFFTEALYDGEKPITSDQRRKIELIINRQPTGIPIASTIANRFNRKSGGQLRRTGIVRAAKESETDPTQTAEMAQELGSWLSYAYDAQNKLDGQYADNAISAQEWIKGERRLGAGYQITLVNAMSKFPKAAQSLKGPEGVRSPKLWQNYLTMVKTGMGEWPDRRTLGQLLAAMHRGVEMPLDADGREDYHAYFQHIDELREAIVEEHGREGIELLDEELLSVMTGMQKDYYNEVGLGAGRGGLRDYWDIAGRIANRTRGRRGRIYRLFLNSNNDVRAFLKSRYGDDISEVQKIVNAERLAFREQYPRMDALYVKWGYAEAGRTPFGEFAERQVVERGRQALSQELARRA
jgi:hypothetical protein